MGKENPAVEERKKVKLLKPIKYSAVERKGERDVPAAVIAMRRALQKNGLQRKGSTGLSEKVDPKEISLWQVSRNEADGRRDNVIFITGADEDGASDVGWTWDTENREVTRKSGGDLVSVGFINKGFTYRGKSRITFIFSHGASILKPTIIDTDGTLPLFIMTDSYFKENARGAVAIFVDDTLRILRKKLFPDDLEYNCSGPFFIPEV